MNIYIAIILISLIVILFLANISGKETGNDKAARNKRKFVIGLYLLTVLALIFPQLKDRTSRLRRNLKL